MKFTKILVGISGGVDSAVAAYLLKSKGFKVTGAFMKNWDDIDENGYCSGEPDWTDAQIVCNKLDIPLIQLNFVKHYWNNVFIDFLKDYQNGLTPNPDILCNRYIKFDQFFKKAMNQINADAIATGHYAQTSFGSYLEDFVPDQDVRLLQAKDSFKDQTFFLCQISQVALRKTMFPLGTYLKEEVKELAKSIGLENIAKKPESTGICFIGSRNFKPFINKYIRPEPGKLIDIDTGYVVGAHEGLHHWTIGQRCRISGCLKPYFVASKDVVSNRIYVASGTDHPSLYSRELVTDEPHWIGRDPLDDIAFLGCKFRFQHTKPLVDAVISKSGRGLAVRLGKELRAITPGQYAVFYSNGECLGCSRIRAFDEAEISSIFDERRRIS